MSDKKNPSENFTKDEREVNSKKETDDLSAKKIPEEELTSPKNEGPPFEQKKAWEDLQKTSGTPDLTPGDTQSSLRGCSGMSILNMSFEELAKRGIEIQPATDIGGTFLGLDVGGTEKILNNITNPVPVQGGFSTPYNNSSNYRVNTMPSHMAGMGTSNGSGIRTSGQTNEHQQNNYPTGANNAAQSNGSYAGNGTMPAGNGYPQNTYDYHDGNGYPQEEEERDQYGNKIPQQSPYAASSSNIGGFSNMNQFPSGNTNGPLVQFSTLSTNPNNTLYKPKTDGYSSVSGKRIRYEFSSFSEQITKNVTYLGVSAAMQSAGAIAQPLFMVRDGYRIVRSVASLAVVDSAQRFKNVVFRDERNRLIEKHLGAEAIKNGKTLKDVKAQLQYQLRKLGVKNFNASLSGPMLEVEIMRIRRIIERDIKKNGGNANNVKIKEMLDDMLIVNRLDTKKGMALIKSKYGKIKNVVTNVSIPITKRIRNTDVGKGYTQIQFMARMSAKAVQSTVRTVKNTVMASVILVRNHAVKTLERKKRQLDRIAKNNIVNLEKYKKVSGKVTKLDKKVTKQSARQANKAIKEPRTRFGRALKRRQLRRSEKKFAKKRARKASRKALAKRAANRLAKRAAGRAFLQTARAARAVAKAVTKAALKIASTLSTVRLWVYIGIGIAVLFVVVMVALESFYINTLAGAFNFGNAEGNVVYTKEGDELSDPEDIKEAANDILAECYQEDFKRMREYKSKNAKNGNATIVYEDHIDYDYYDENDEGDVFEEASNSAEILSMAYTYFGLDIETDEWEEVEEEDDESGGILKKWREISEENKANNTVSLSDLQSYIQHLYWNSHEITAETTTELDERETGEVIDFDIEYDDGTVETVEQDEIETVDVTNAQFTYETYYFPYLYEIAESDDFWDVNETKWTSISTGNYYDSITDEQGVYVALRAAGLSHEGACGVMGNLYQESGINPSSGTSLYGGIAQWGYGARYDDMEAFCAEHGYDPLTLTGQVNFLIDDILNNRPGFGLGDLCSLLQTSTDIQKCTEVFMVYYECCYTKKRTDGCTVYHYAKEYPYPGVTDDGYYYSKSDNAYYLWGEMEYRINYAKGFAEKYSSIKDSWQELMGASSVCDAARALVADPLNYYPEGMGYYPPHAMDCSGFVCHAYKTAGYPFNGGTDLNKSDAIATSELEQIALGNSYHAHLKRVDVSSSSWDGWMPGDIIVKRSSSSGHTGIYLGNSEVAESMGHAYGLRITTYAAPSSFSTSHPTCYCLRWYD